MVATHTAAAPAPIRCVQVRLPTSLAIELDRAASLTMGTAAAYLRRALLDRLERDGFNLPRVTIGGDRE